MGIASRSQMGDMSEPVRMGLKVEHRSDMKKLLGIVDHYMDQAGRELQETSAEVSRLLQVNHHLIDRTRSLESQVQGNGSQQDKVIAELEQHLEGKEAALSSAQSRIEELEASVSSKEARCSTLESSLAAAAEAHQFSEKEQEGRALRLEGELDSAKKHCGGLEQKIGEWQRKYKDDNKKLAEAVRALRGEKLELGTKISMVEKAWVNAVSEKDEIIEKLQGEIDSLQQGMRQQREERSTQEAERVAQLEASLKSASARNAELQGEQFRIANLVDAMHESSGCPADTEASTVQKLEKVSLQVRKERDCLNSRLGVESSRRQQAEDRITDLEIRCSTADEELKLLQSQHNELLAVRESLDRQLSEERQDAAKMKRVRLELERLQAFRREIVAERDSALVELEKLKEENGKAQGLGDEVGFLRSENQLLRQHSFKSARLTSDLELATNENKELKDRLARKEAESKEVADLQERVGELTAENAALKRADGEMKGRLTRLETGAKEHAALEVKVKSLHLRSEQCESLSREVEATKGKLGDAVASKEKHEGPKVVQIDSGGAEFERLNARKRALTSRQCTSVELGVLKAQLADSAKLVNHLKEQLRVVGLERDQLVAAQASTQQELLRAGAKNTQASDKNTGLEIAPERAAHGSIDASQIRSQARQQELDVMCSGRGDAQRPAQQGNEPVETVSGEVREIFSELLGCDIPGLPTDGPLDPTALGGFLERVGQSNGQLALIETRTRKLRGGEAQASPDDMSIGLDLRVVLADMLDELARKCKKINEITIHKLLASFEASSAVQPPNPPVNNVSMALTRNAGNPTLRQSNQVQAIEPQLQKSWTRRALGQASTSALRPSRSLGSHDELAGGYQRPPERGTATASSWIKGPGPQDAASPQDRGAAGVRSFLGELGAKMSQGSELMQKVSHGFISRAAQPSQQQRQVSPQGVQSDQTPPG
eukprot:evm.model.scf_823.7 EVM.evm.TU.scf_823.7   scf_823:34530-38443(+)